MDVEKWLCNAQPAEPDAGMRDRVIHAALVRSSRPGMLPLYSLAGLVFAIVSVSSIYVVTSPTPQPVRAAVASTAEPAPAAETLRPVAVLPLRTRQEEDEGGQEKEAEVSAPYAVR